MVITLRKLIYDPKTILTKHGFTTDSRFQDNYLKHKILERREQFANIHFQQYGIIYPELIEDFGIVEPFEVTNADDASIDYCCVGLGKLDIPRVITMFDSKTGNSDLALYIKSPCGKKEYHYTSLNMFMALPKDHLLIKERRYMRIHNATYISPMAKQVRVLAILADPTEGYINDNLPKASGSLKVGTSYTVKNAQIIHDSVVYDVDETFTATVTTYTGNGLVVLTTPKRKRTWDDDFPIPFLMAQEIMLDLLTKEFGLEAKVIADTIQDSRDQLQLMSNNVA